MFDNDDVGDDDDGAVMCLRLSPDKPRAARSTVCLSGSSQSTALARFLLVLYHQLCTT